MIRKLLGAPLKIVKKLLGREAPAAKPPAPVRRPSPPRPAPAAAPEGGGHDHGHSHGRAEPEPAGGHDHGHSHGRAEPEPEGGHDHGHSHGGPKAAVGANIQVDESETPNPNAHKFTCSVTVIEKGSASFNTAEEAASHPLGKHIWPLGGVKGIFAVKDFVTVTKTPEADWNDLSRRIPDAIRRGLVERDGQS